MKFSIIVPVYNAEKYLKHCLESLVNQTFKDIEIIIIDDGSSDASARICESYCFDPRVIYHYQNNAGVSVARNRGLDLAKGEYICFVDSDDWLELDALERLQNETADIVVYNFYHGDKKHIEPVTDGIYTKEMLFPNAISFVDEQGEVRYQCHNIWMRLFKRSFLENNSIRFNAMYQNGEDLLFTLIATMNATIISVRCSDYLYHYRPNQKSQTTSYISNYWNLRKRIIEELYTLIQNDCLYRQLPLRIFLWVVVGIENELRYSQGRKENIRLILTDPICNIFKGNIDTSVLNEKNRAYYKQICDRDYRGIWKNYHKKVFLGRIRKKLRKFKNNIKFNIG